MKFIKENQTLVISKTDAIYDVVLQCWCVPPKNERESYYEMPNETTAVVEFEGFLHEVIFTTLMNRLIEISNTDEDKTHIYRIYIGWLLLFQIQNDLEPKDATNFNTMQKTLQAKSQVNIPSDFKFSKLKEYKQKNAEEILNDIILYDLIRAENGILKPTKNKKEGKLKRVSRKGSQILTKAAETARQHSPFRSRSRSNSVSSTSPSKLQISAPLAREGQYPSDNESDQPYVTDEETTERSRLIPPSPTITKQPSYSTGRVADPNTPASAPSSAPHAAFYTDTKDNRSRSASAASNNTTSAGSSADTKSTLPPLELLFTTMYSKNTGEIIIDCPSATCAKIIHTKFGPSVARQMHYRVYITPQNWTTHKQHFMANLEPEYQNLPLFIERTYCSVMGIPHKPPTATPLPVNQKSIQDELEDNDEKSTKCCFCF